MYRLRQRSQRKSLLRESILSQKKKEGEGILALIFMPAVELSRLQTQISLVSQHYASPVDFVKRLCDLYEFYSDRTFSQAASTPRSLTLPSYNVTPLINRQFEMYFSKLCKENPISSLEVIDALWQQPRLEPRQLAAFLLGKIPLAYSDEVIHRLKSWSRAEEDHELVRYLQDKGSLLLRKENIKDWLAVIQTWLESSDSQDQIFGMQSLLPLISDPDYSNLPKIFDLLAPHLASYSPRVTYTMQTVIEALAMRSPNETVYLLKSILDASASKDLARLIRRMLPVFQEEQQISLKAALAGFQR